MQYQAQKNGIPLNQSVYAYTDMAGAERNLLTPHLLKKRNKMAKLDYIALSTKDNSILGAAMNYYILIAQLEHDGFTTDEYEIFKKC